MALVIGIVGLMVGGALTVYKTRSQTIRVQETQAKLRVIDKALQNYYFANGFLPCPADPAQPDASATFGNALAYTSSSARCAALAEPLAIVPVRTLGLADEMAYDAWGRRISYQLSDGMGDVAGFTNDQLHGRLQVINTQGVRVTDLTFGAAYVLISHGNNGVYAWLRTGLKYLSGSVGLEDDNGSGTDNRFTMGGLASGFDDVGLFRTKAEVFLVRRMARPMEIQGAVCTNARALVNTGLSAFLAMPYGVASTTRATRIFSVATAIDRLCTKGLPSNTTTPVCGRNTLWLTATDASYPRTYPDCYCPVDLNIAPDQSVQLDYTNQNFGRCM